MANRTFLGIILIQVTIGLLVLNTFAYLHFAPKQDLTSGKTIETPAQRVLTAVFFSIQTFTTTGYGSGFSDFNDGLKVVACIFMVLGSLSWAAVVAWFVSLIVPSTCPHHP